MRANDFEPWSKIRSNFHLPNLDSRRRFHGEESFVHVWRFELGFHVGEVEARLADERFATLQLARVDAKPRRIVFHHPMTIVRLLNIDPCGERADLVNALLDRLFEVLQIPLGTAHVASQFTC